MAGELQKYIKWQVSALNKFFVYRRRVQYKRFVILYECTVQKARTVSFIYKGRPKGFRKMA
jgi:hypothetical protein